MDAIAAGLQSSDQVNSRAIRTTRPDDIRVGVRYKHFSANHNCARLVRDHTRNCCSVSLAVADPGDDERRKDAQEELTGKFSNTGTSSSSAELTCINHRAYPPCHSVHRRKACCSHTIVKTRWKFCWDGIESPSEWRHRRLGIPNYG